MASALVLVAEQWLEPGATVEGLSAGVALLPCVPRDVRALTAGLWAALALARADDSPLAAAACVAGAAVALLSAAGLERRALPAADTGAYVAVLADPKHTHSHGPRPHAREKKPDGGGRQPPGGGGPAPDADKDTGPEAAPRDGGPERTSPEVRRDPAPDDDAPERL